MAQHGEQSDWVFPYPYTLRKSRRAKRINLKISRDSGLELVVPYRVANKEALHFLYERIAWVEKHAHHLKPREFIFPEDINLQAMQKAFMVRYDFCKRARATIKAIDDFEIVYIGANDSSSVQRALIRWLNKQAKAFLSEQLKSLSLRTGLSFSSLTCRKQKTLWGSCSQRKAISLNYKLVFLPCELMMYVLLHELCHTVHMNHSTCFWNLLESYLPSYLEKEAALKKAQAYIPDWYLFKY